MSFYNQIYIQNQSKLADNRFYKALPLLSELVRQHIYCSMMEQMDEMDAEYERDPSEENHRYPNQTKHEHMSHREEKLEHDEAVNMIDMMDLNDSDEVNEVREEKKQKQESDCEKRATVDLNKCLFTTIVQHCFHEKLISDDVAHSFFTNYTIGHGKRYIQLFRANKLHEFDFAKCKINIIDHRRLTEMLIRHRPERYLPLTPPENPFDFVKEIHQFFKQIYAHNLSTYEHMIESQAFMHYQTWWGGPMRTDSMDPIKLHQAEESRKAREAKQAAILARSIQEEREREKRINNHQVTEADLKQIANSMLSKLIIGASKDIKYEGDEIYHENEDSSSKGSKHKKVKKDKEREKSKKNKKKKDKRHKIEENEQYQAKREAETSKPEERRSRKVKKEATE